MFPLMCFLFRVRLNGDLIANVFVVSSPGMYRHLRQGSRPWASEEKEDQAQSENRDKQARNSGKQLPGRGYWSAVGGRGPDRGLPPGVWNEWRDGNVPCLGHRIGTP